MSIQFEGDLFPSTAATSEDGKDGEYQRTAKFMKAPNGYELAARKLLKQPDSWEVYAWKVLRRDSTMDLVEVKGAIPFRITKTGRRIWRGKGQTAVVSDKECQNALLAWEQKCGSCASCGGDGKEMAGWSEARGYRLRRCRQCGGTGKPRRASAPIVFRVAELFVASDPRVARTDDGRLVLSEHAPVGVGAFVRKTYNPDGSTRFARIGSALAWVVVPV